MDGLGLELWLAFLAAAIALGVAAYVMARKDDALDWDTNRRDEERRNTERRSGKERRSLSRLLHDRLHNPGRRRNERRGDDRRSNSDWRTNVEQVRERVESVKQDNRNREAQ
jgi:hypothetical protein